MSWSVTVDDLDKIEHLPDETMQRIGYDNPAYILDALSAFRCAKRAGLKSAALSGGRTPSPYNQRDSVVISIVGFAGDDKFNETMLGAILSGPDPE